MLANKVMKIIFGPNIEIARRKWRKLHKDKIHNLYSSLCIARVIKARVGGARRPNTHGEDKQMRTFV